MARMQRKWLALSLLIMTSVAAPPAALAQSAEPAPNAENQRPAFPGQTRAPRVVSGVTLEAQIVASGLEQPWALEFLPDGRVLVSERAGRLRIVTRAGEVSAPLRGLPPIFVNNQGGLLDVALSPNFAADRMIYWSYAEPRGWGANGTSVARGRLSADETRLESVEIIFRQLPAWRSRHHFGSRLVFDREGRLYVTTGERNSGSALAQNLNTHLGKVIRLNADGGVPADNPFVGRAGARTEIWSYGHRNIQAADLHPETGALWTLEHGPRGGDELNAPRAGRNYGWPIISYGEDYGGSPIGEGITARAGMEQPIYYWDPVIAPGGMRFYRGALFPWRGDLLIAGLASQALVRLELEGERVVGEERFALGVGRVRDVAEAADGAIWIVTDEADGRLIRLTPGG